VQVNLTSGNYTVPGGKPFGGAFLAGNTASGGWGATVSLGSANISSVVGTGGGDVFIVGSGDNVQGNGGNDLFVINGGNNTLTAGNGTQSTFLFIGAGGNNVLNGGGNATVDFSQSGNAVTVNLQQNFASGGFGGGNQTLHGILNIIGSTGGHSVLIASAPNATVIGLGASDFLEAGPQGRDILINQGPSGDTFCAQSSCASSGTVAGGGDTLIATQSTSGNFFFAKNGAVDVIEEAPNPLNTLVTDPNDQIVIV
jgi:hypothetical protein